MNASSLSARSRATVVAVPAAPTTVCPPWCTVPQEQHAAALRDHEGLVIHWSAENEGRVQHAACTFVDGTPDPEEPPEVYVRGQVDGLRLEAAEQLAGALLAAVQEARA